MGISLEEYYSQFGSECVREIRRQIELNGTLASFLQKLGIVPVGGPEEHREALRAFLHRFGVGFFMRASKFDFRPDVVERMKTDRLIELAKPRRPAVLPPLKNVPRPPPRAGQVPFPPKQGPTLEHAPGATSPKAAAPEVASKPQPGAPSAGTATGAPASGGGVGGAAGSTSADSATGALPGAGAKMQPPQTAQGSSPAVADKAAPELPVINVPGYSGVDRRKDHGRRLRKLDRRANVDPILFRNRRFGGERRKIVRRKWDREVVYKLSNLPQHANHNAPEAFCDPLEKG